MGVYIKKFNEHYQYLAYKNSSAFTAPNTSVCVNNDNELHYSGLIKPIKFVDLGLKSGTLWAESNLGASRPQDPGLYFAWGELSGYTEQDVLDGKKYFFWNDYELCNYESEGAATKSGCYVNSMKKYSYSDNKTRLELQDDAAYNMLGQEWRIPASWQFEELFQNEYNVIYDDNTNYPYYVEITSKNNGEKLYLYNFWSIAEGEKRIWSYQENCTGNWNYNNNPCMLWTNELASCTYSSDRLANTKNLYCDDGCFLPTDGWGFYQSRYCGLQIRPVKIKNSSGEILTDPVNGWCGD